MSDAAPPTIVLHLPIPPSANRMWRSVPGQRKPMLSGEYRQWLTDAGWIARTQLVGAPTILGAFTALINVPMKSRRDRDNWTKPLFDLCQKIGAIRNDRGLGQYTVIPADRDDCMVALWDSGGPPLPEPKRRRPSGPPAAEKEGAPGQYARISLARIGR